MSHLTINDQKTSINYHTLSISLLPPHAKVSSRSMITQKEKVEGQGAAVITKTYTSARHVMWEWHEAHNKARIEALQ